MAEEPYGPRTLAAIENQCEVRGIPPEEVESVRAHIADEMGKSVLEMDEAELRRLNRNLPSMMEDYLDGKKRRGGPADPWETGGEIENGEPVPEDG